MTRSGSRSSTSRPAPRWEASSTSTPTPTAHSSRRSPWTWASTRGSSRPCGSATPATCWGSPPTPAYRPPASRRTPWPSPGRRPRCCSAWGWCCWWPAGSCSAAHAGPTPRRTSPPTTTAAPGTPGAAARLGALLGGCVVGHVLGVADLWADLGRAAGRAERVVALGEEGGVGGGEVLPLRGHVVLVEDGLHRADGLAGAAVHAFVGVDVEHAVA